MATFFAFAATLAQTAVSSEFSYKVRPHVVSFENFMLFANVYPTPFLQVIFLFHVDFGNAVTSNCVLYSVCSKRCVFVLLV